MQDVEKLISILRIDISGHPILEEPYQIKESYFKLFEAALNKITPPNYIGTKVVALYNLMFGYNFNKNILCNEELYEHFKIIKKNYYNRQFLFFRKARNYKYLLALDVLYFLHRLGDVRNSIEIKDWLGKNLKISSKMMQKATDYFKILFTKTDKTLLKSFGNNKLSKHLEYFYERYIQSLTLEHLPQRNIAVVAAMSAGKSTFINTLLGCEILPAMQHACTSTVITIYNNNNLKKVHAIGYGATSSFNFHLSENLNLQTLRDWNNDGKVSNIYFELKFDNIRNADKLLVMYDTPGTNFSLNPKHHETTYKIVETNTTDVIIYIINATQLATDDDNALLKKVYESVNTCKMNTKVLFLLNKIDTFDLDGYDNINKAVYDAVKHIESTGFKNPELIPISAYGALLFKKALHGDKFSKKEALDFKSLYAMFSEDAVDLTTYAKTLKIPNINFNTQLGQPPGRHFSPGSEEHVVHINGVSYKNILEALERTAIPLVERKIQLLLQNSPEERYK